MTWASGPLVAFDTETTGVDVDADRIVTAAVITITPQDGGRPTVGVRTTVIDPGVEVPAAAAEIHSWTTEKVREHGKPPAGELDWIAADLCRAWVAGTPVVVANAPFDLTMLDRELARHNLPTLTDRLDGAPLGPVVDPMVLDKQVDRYRRGGRKLVDLCAHYEVTLGAAHDCTEDALAAARVAYQIARRHPEIGDMALPELHAAQAGWYADQAEGLAQWWRRKANELDHQADSTEDDAEAGTLHADAEDLRARADGVSTQWPIRTAVAS